MTISDIRVEFHVIRVTAAGVILFAIALYYFRNDLVEIFQKSNIQTIAPETLPVKKVPARITCRYTKIGKVCTA